VNRGITQAVLNARPGRIVLASSVAVYGAWPDNPCPLAESHPPRPNRECPYALQKLETERALLGGLSGAALRICAVLGPHVDPRVGHMTKGYRLAVPAVRGARQRLQFLHEDDAAAALHLAGTAQLGGVCNVAPDGWMDASDIARVAGSRVLSLPRSALLSMSEAARLLRAAPFGADRSVLLSGPLAADPALAAQALGWQSTRTSAQVLGDFLGASQPASPTAPKAPSCIPPFLIPNSRSH
jgi:UDP-glucose 4-epimerase